MNGREAVGPRVRRNAPEVEGRSGQTVPSPFILSVAQQREVEGSLSKDERGDTVVMSFWVYMLRCGDGSYYTGHTDDLEHRLHQHQAGTFGGYTSSGNPCRWSIPVHFRRGKRRWERNDRLRVGVERRKRPCCAETGPRSIGYLVGNININGLKGPSTRLRTGPSTSLTLRSGRTGGKPSSFA